MTKENFATLLSDLYQAYNPEFIKYIPQLVDKYNRLEFDSIQNIFIKYNHESYNHYDPEKSTDEYIHQLISDYTSGERTLKDLHIKVLDQKSHNQKQAEAEDKVHEKSREEVSEIKKSLTETDKKIDEINKNIEDTLSKKIEELKKFESEIKKLSIYDNVEISIKSMYTESELILPNKEILVGLGKGTRLIVSDQEGKVIGLVIEEILYDCISHPLGTPIIEIVISKG